MGFRVPVYEKRLNPCNGPKYTLICPQTRGSPNPPLGYSKFGDLYEFSPAVVRMACGLGSDRAGTAFSPTSGVQEKLLPTERTSARRPN